jgi:hypothetical protein
MWMSRSGPDGLVGAERSTPIRTHLMNENDSALPLPSPSHFLKKRRVNVAIKLISSTSPPKPRLKNSPYRKQAVEARRRGHQGPGGHPDRGRLPPARCPDRQHCRLRDVPRRRSSSRRNDKYQTRTKPRKETRRHLNEERG